jgi:hypothetical protein
MASELTDGPADSVTLRFVGEEKDGGELHELRAAHVAEVLQGLVGLSSDFGKAGAFGDGPFGSEVLVRPAQEGSFLIEVVRTVQHADPEVVAAWTGVLGVPSLGTVLLWATKSMRADVSDFEYLDNGNVKVSWQDDTVDEIPLAAWQELNKRKRRRKKQLQQIMAPLSDSQVSSLEVQHPSAAEVEAGEATESFTLTRPDYDAANPADEIDERQDIFDVEAQMSAIDFDNPTRWRVKTAEQTRNATVEDPDFLGRVANGLAIRKSDIFRLKVREDAIEKNGRTRRTWTVLEVESFRRAAHDDDE